MSGRPINEDRQRALEFGLPTYTGTPHPKCGTTERYTASCGCVYCGRTKAAAQRAALRTLEAQEAVDNSAEARYRQGIEDLM